MIKVRPGYMVVRPDKAETMSEGGIALPKDDKEVLKGEVLLTGGSHYIHVSGTELPSCVHVGSRVWYKRFQTNEIEVKVDSEDAEPEKLYVMHETDLIAFD